MSGLPFLLKKKSPSTVVYEHRAPDEKDDGNQGLKTCASDLIAAINEGSADKVASALRAAFEILDSEPHEEGPHIEPNEDEETE